MSDPKPSPPASGRYDATGDIPFRMLGPYQILDRIGRGGMGDVYRGWDAALGRAVAIKVLPGELANDHEFIRRFYAEATAAARLVHPNIVAIYYIGEEAGHHFFAMQYVDGETLADLLERRGRLEVIEVLAIIEQVLAGLSAAHDQGLVHRDIKPGNILLDRDERRALLADFGLVKSLQERHGLTATGLIMGTVDYMAPEQGRGQSLDGRADLYSVGVLMYEMLSGQLPFEADSPTGMIFQHVYETPPLLRDVAADVPAPLSEIVARLLAKRPEDRYPDAATVMADVRAFRAGRPLRSTREAPPRGAETRWSTPDPVEEPGLPAQLDLLIPHGWIARVREWLKAYLEEAAPELVQRLQNTQQQLDGAVAEYERRHARLRDAVEVAEEAFPESPREATSAANENEQLASLRLQLAQVAAQLEQLRSRRDVLNARLKVAQARIRVADGQTPRSWRRRTVIAAGLVAACLLVSILAFAALRRRGGAEGVLAPTSAPPEEIASNALKPLNVLLNLDEPITAVAFDSEGGVVGSVSVAGTVRFQNARTSTLLSSFALGTTGELPLEWDMPRRHLYTAVEKNGSSEIQQWDSAGQLRRIGIVEGKVHAFAMASAPARIAVLSGDANSMQLELWDAASGKRTHTRDVTDPDSQRIAISSDGHSVLVASSQGRIHWWHTEQDEFRQISQDEHANISALAFHPGGAQFVSGDAEGVVRFWKLGEGTSNAELKAEGPVQSLVYDLKGRRLAVVTSDSVELWDLGLGCRRAVFEVSNALTAAFSPDQQQLVTGGANPSLQLWDCALPLMVFREEAVASFAPDADKRLNELKANYQKASLEGVSITAADISPDGHLAVLGDRYGIVSLWNLDTAERLPRGLPGGRGDSVHDVEFSPDGRRVLVNGGGDQRVVLWDVRTGVVLNRLEMNSFSVTAVAYSPDGRYFATGGLDRETRMGEIRLWDAATGRHLRTSTRHRGYPLDVAFSPDGNRLLSGGDKMFYFWDVESAREIQHFSVPLTFVEFVAFSSDGQYALAGQLSRHTVWHLELGEEVARFRGVDPTWPLDVRALIPDDLPRVRILTPPTPPEAVSTAAPASAT